MFAVQAALALAPRAPGRTEIDAAAGRVRIGARGGEANKQNHAERAGLRPREDG